MIKFPISFLKNQIIIKNFARKKLADKLDTLKNKLKAKDDKIKPVVHENEKILYTKLSNKNFIEPDQEFLSKHNYGLMSLPELLLKRANQVFGKYPPHEIREASKKYLKIYQLLHAIEKPMDLTKNNPFINTSQLLEKKKDLIYQMKKRKKKEYISVDDFYTKKDNSNMKKESLKDKFNELSNNNYDKENLISNPYPVPVYDRSIAIAYLARKLPENYCQMYRILLEVRKKMPNKIFTNILDFGAGLGGSSHAINQIFEGVKLICNIEKSKEMKVLGKFLTQDYNNIIYKQDLSLAESTNQNKKFDMIILSCVLEELADANERLITIESLWDMLDDEGVLVVNEPGSPMGFRFINDVRKILIENEPDNNIIGPCPHNKACPLAKNPTKWCNFEQVIARLNKNILPKSPKELPQIKTKFSYVIIQKNKPRIEEDACNDIIQKSLHWNRILSPIKKRGGHIIIEQCNAEGDLTEITVARSHNEENRYKISKKLKWGDQYPFDIRIPNKYRKESKHNKRLW